MISDSIKGRGHVSGAQPGLPLWQLHPIGISHVPKQQQVLAAWSRSDTVLPVDLLRKSDFFRNNLPLPLLGFLVELCFQLGQ